MKFRLVETLSTETNVDNVGGNDETTKKVGVKSIDKSDVRKATLLTIEQAKELRDSYLEAPTAWWLHHYAGCRSIYCVPCVTRTGLAVSNYSDVYETHGVRPALKLNNQKSLDLEIGDICEINGQLFRYVLPGILLANDIVGESVFRTKEHCFELWNRSKYCNGYIGSDVEAFVNDWFEKL